MTFLDLVGGDLQGYDAENILFKTIFLNRVREIFKDGDRTHHFYPKIRQTVNSKLKITES